MQCPSCGTDNPPSADRCSACGKPMGLRARPKTDPNARTITEVPLTGWSKPSAASYSSSQLAPGSDLGGRYEILQLLGEGGMGAVYKARDREVDRLVALKVIRPELANQSDILNRFKQELILARQITHKNVIRIFDLGQADGVKFITMEFVQGRDLHSLIRDGEKLTVQQKVRIIHQVCRALEAAHSESVIHRDLKPHNIMVEETGRVVVMDFGIARSMEQAGVTSTGALIGTPAYMSPEQAKGDKIDTRSDLFALGVIFYELLTGKAPYQSETVVGLLLKRIQERPVPVIELDKEIPPAISEIVMKCLAVNVEDRYQTAQEVARDLEGWEGAPTTFRTMFAPPAPVLPPGPSRRRFTLQVNWALMAALALFLAGLGFFLRGRFQPAAPKAHAPVSVVIADFNNHTGDAVFDGTLEETLRLALEGATFINAYDRAQMRRGLGVPPPEKLDDQAAAKLAVSQGLGMVVSGSLERQGAAYNLSIKASQAVTGNPVVTAEERAADKDQVLFTVTKVAAAVRKALGDDTSESAQRFAMETLTAASLEAVHEYALGMDALSSGKFEDAHKKFSNAVDLDSNFGVAYMLMGVSSRNMGQMQDAEREVKLALAHIDRMTERERYRTRGFYYLLTGDNQKCVEEYSALIARYSSDVAAHNNLALCSTELRNMPKAIEEMQRTVAILPKRAIYRINLSLYESYGSDFARAEQDARLGRELGPSVAQGFIATAFAALGQDKVPDAVEAYRQLQNTDASWAASALGDLALYQGRFSEALGIFQKAADDDISGKKPDRAAEKLVMLAYGNLLLGRKAAAVSAANRSVAYSKLPKIRFLAGHVLAAEGDSAAAQNLASGLASELQIEPQSYGKLIQGDILLQVGNTRDAIKTFNEGVKLLDTWIGRFDLGRAYLEDKDFAEADSEFDRCIRRRGEAMALFLDEVPTSSYFPAVYYYQGRTRESMKTAGFADSYRKYLAIRASAGEDPLLPEVRRRAGQ